MNNFDEITQFVFEAMLEAIKKEHVGSIIAHDAFVLPDDMVNFLKLARSYGFRLERDMWSKYIKSQLQIEQLTDPLIKQWILERLTPSFPVRQFHAGAGLYGHWTIRYDGDRAKSLYRQTAHQICYGSGGYSKGIRKMKELNIKPEPFGVTMADHIEGTMFAIRPQFSNIRQWLRGAQLEATA